MTPRLRAARLGLLRPATFEATAPCRCTSRRYAAAAAATAATTSQDSLPPSSPSRQANPTVKSSTTPDMNYAVRAGIVLSRAPQITRDLSSFEKAFFLYQRRMNERTAMPFPRYFYIKRGTPADIDWKRKIKDRKTPARDIGNWSAWDRQEGWNDELLVGSKISEPSEHVERLLKDTELHEDAVDETIVYEEREVFERPQPRVTAADEKNDTKSLNRALTRSLYLLVKPEDGRWQFPSSLLEGDESLHRGAERVIVQTGGINMNTWIVGHAPVGFHTWNYSSPEKNNDTACEQIGEKTFFMKGRILAGMPNLSDNRFGWQDHQWLAREEVQALVRPSYWNSIKHILPTL